MYKIIYGVLLILLSFNNYAQRPNQKGKIEESSILGQISGNIIDSVSQNPVEFAIVELLSAVGDKQVNGVISDEKGHFVLADIKTGKYKLKVSFLGYNPKIINSVELTLKKPDLNLGKINMKPSDFMLNEVQIVDQRSVIESKVDRIIFNATNDPTLVGGDATDVLRKVPMLSVDIDGNVSLRGSQKVIILLNGKPSSLFSDDVGEALQMFPADEIQKVEVLTSPGARYDAEGSAGIINIVTKKSILQGLNGSVRSFVSNRMQQGNASLAIGKGRYGYNAKLGLRYKLPAESEVVFHRETTNEFGTRTLDQLGTSDLSRLGINGTIGAFYDLNAFNSFNTSLRLNNLAYKNNGTQESIFSNPLMNYTRISSGNQMKNSLNWTTDYTKKFQGNDERKLIVAFQVEGDLNKNKNDKNLSIDDFTENNLNDISSTEFTGQIDYIHPLNKSFKIETGIKSIFRDMNSDFSRVYIFPPNIESLDKNNSDIFSYKQNVYSAYLSGTWYLPYGFSVMPGLRFEETFIKGSFENYDKPFENYYDNWFPSITLNKKFKDFSNIKLSFDKRLSRPSIDNIDPFVDSQDPQSIKYGNPYLYPEITSNYEIVYSKFLKGATINLSLFYKNTDDIIESYLFIDTNNISNTTYYNIGTADSYGFNIFGSITLFKIWQTRGNFNLNKYFINADNLTENAENDAIRYNASVSSSLNLKTGWQMEISGHFNSPNYTLQGKIAAFSMYMIGIQKEIWNKKAKIGLRVAHPFAENKIMLTELSGNGFFQSNQISIPMRSYGISFSYNFGKLDMKSRKEVIKNEDQKRENGNDDMEN